MITLTTSKSWQDLDVCTELATYYNYRGAFLGLAALTAPVVGDGVCAFIADLQTRVTATAFYSAAVKPSASFAGIASGSSYPVAYGVSGISQLYTDAGIDSGFRRLPRGSANPTDWTDYADAAFSYGAAQAGDIIGPWLFVDLQTMLLAVKVFKVSVQRAPKFVGSPSGTVLVPNEYMTWSETDIYDPGDSYPTTDGTYADETDTTFSEALIHRCNGAWFNPTEFSHAFTWQLTHYRFGIRAIPFSSARSVHKTQEFYARVVPDGSDVIWTYPYGLESTATKKIEENTTSNADNGFTYNICGNRITDSASVFPAKPAYSTDPEVLSDTIGPYSAKLTDMVARVALDY